MSAGKTEADLKAEFVDAYYNYAKTRDGEYFKEMLRIHRRLFKLTKGAVPLNVFDYIPVLKEELRQEWEAKRKKKTTV
ncbi:hypothetical protein [Alkalibacillus silvisoli]|uniref:Uncharacterized protein n=1 Tax=Alkalibacillus silvisoli TaxID=392823 RepID=A0ABP3K1T3_9BACI